MMNQEKIRKIKYKFDIGDVVKIINLSKIEYSYVSEKIKDGMKGKIVGLNYDSEYEPLYEVRLFDDSLYFNTVFYESELILVNKNNIKKLIKKYKLKGRNIL